MAADSPNDQELALKKRARRRLVGAIALVLLMVIVLPMVLQDRAALAPQESIKITMPDEVASQQPAVEPDASQELPKAEVAVIESTKSEPISNESIKSESPVKSESINSNQVTSDEKNTPEVKSDESQKNEKKPEAKPSEVKATELKKADEVKTQAPSAKPQTSGETFTIQVGVFSELSNVKQLQARLKEVGFDSRTENISTPKGEKIRLRAGRFNSRQEAAYALTKLQAADLTGMVISNN